MSKGSQIVQVRITDNLMVAIETEIIRTNRHTKQEPYCLSSWIRAAILEKLSKGKRSRKCHGSTSSTSTTPTTTPATTPDAPQTSGDGSQTTPAAEDQSLPATCSTTA